MKGVLFALAALALPLAASAGGAVVSIDGKAALERGQQSFNVVEALPVEAGDTLTVKAQSKVQLQFDDDSLFTIPGAAVVRVDTFDLPKAGPGKAVYTLVDGGLRTDPYHYTDEGARWVAQQIGPEILGLAMEG